MTDRNTIYLAGLISTDFPESLQWRLDAEKLLGEHFKVLSPMRGKDDLYRTTNDGGVNDPNLTSKDIILRDYRDVQSSDVVLVHLESFGSPRPLIGTLFELAWCWEELIPVVGIASTENYLMRQHPFVRECVAHYSEDLEEACAFAIKHYV